MQKAYSRINWENYPSTDTPLNETNLNSMDSALNTVDDRVVSMDTTKTNQTDFLTVVQNVTLNSTNGVITVTFVNGSTQTYDTKLEKLAVNFYYDDDPTSAHYQSLVITLDDGTVQYVDMSALVTQYEFGNTATISFTNTSGTISANVVDGGITRAKLSPDYLAEIEADLQAAEDSADEAEAQALNAEAWAKGTKNDIPVTSDAPQYENNSQYFVEFSEAWAVGQRGGVDVEASDETYQNNSKYYCGVSENILEAVREHANQTEFSVNFTNGELEYTESSYTFLINETTGQLTWGVTE